MMEPAATAAIDFGIRITQTSSSCKWLVASGKSDRSRLVARRDRRSLAGCRPFLATCHLSLATHDSAKERPAEQHGLVEDLDRLAEQVIRQVGAAAVHPGADLGT